MNDNELYVLTQGNPFAGSPNGELGIYTLSGSAVDASFLTGLDNPVAFAIETPEPSTAPLLLMSLAGCFGFGLLRRTYKRRDNFGA